MPQPARAAITCSMVETVTPEGFAIKVQRREGTTASQRAGISASPEVTSTRRNQMP